MLASLRLAFLPGLHAETILSFYLSTPGAGLPASPQELGGPLAVSISRSSLSAVAPAAGLRSELAVTPRRWQNVFSRGGLLPGSALLRATPYLGTVLTSPASLFAPPCLSDCISLAWSSHFVSLRFAHVASTLAHRLSPLLHALSG